MRSQKLQDLPVCCMAQCGGRADHDTDEMALTPLAHGESTPTTHQMLV